MNDLTGSLNFLSWPTQVVNELRAMLADINIPLPALLAQLLAVAVLVAAGWYLFGRAKSRRRSIGRAAARATLAAVAVGILSIFAAWADNQINKRPTEIFGRLGSPDISGVQVDLLDYRGESLGPQVEVDTTGAFVVRYTPVFADPPKALKIRAQGCEDLVQPLTRAHLLGAEMTVQMTCEDGG
ncbi:MAG: hypothetical protein WBS20_18050 [Lysobacterales bacterium]